MSAESELARTAKASSLEKSDLYTSPMLIRTPVMGLHKERICYGIDYDESPISGGCCHEAGVGSHLLAHGMADFVHVLQHRFTHAAMCPCLT